MGAFSAATASHRFLVASLMALAPVLLVACGGGADDSTPSGPDEESTGQLVVKARSSGSDLDQDGYSLKVGGFEERTLSVNGEITFSDLSPTTVSIEFGDVVVNCRPEDALSRNAEITAGQETEVVLRVSCFEAKEIAFSASFDIRVAEENGSNRRLFVADASGPSWSPDGQDIAYTALSQGEFVTFVANPDGSGAEVAIVHGAGGGPPSWSPDGSRLAISSSDYTDIVVGKSDGSGEQHLTDPPQGTQDLNPRWSPTGESIAFIRYDRSGSESHAIMLISPNGGSTEEVYRDSRIHIPNTSQGWNLDWSPDGNALVFMRGKPMGSGSDIYQIHLQSGSLTNLSESSPSDFNVNPRYSPEGSRVVFSGSFQLYSVNTDGSDLRDASPTGFTGLARPSISSDGERVTFQAIAPGGSNFQIWAVRIDGTGLTQVTADGSEDSRNPVWRPEP